MKRPGGPDLKLSRPRVPQPLADVYQDLRDRHLLPLVALIVVAIVAVPFLLGSDSEGAEEAPGAREVVKSLRSAAADAPALTVVEARPGLRDYRRRLKGRTSTNPFKQHHTGPSLRGTRFPDGGTGGGGDSEATVKTDTGGSSGEGGGGDGSSGGGGGKVTVPSGDSGGAEPAPGSGDDGGGDPRRVRRGLILFDWGIDVRMRRIANGEKSEPLSRERVLPQTALPGSKARVVTYMGPAREGKKINGRVLLLISDQVREVASDGRCVSGKGVCQLLEVTPGFPVVLTFGESEARYVLSVERLRLVVTGRR